MNKLTLLLLLSSTTHGYSLRRPQDFVMTQAGELESGIFDRAAAKIMKDQEDKQKAKEYLSEMAQQSQIDATKEKLHQKNLMAAQKEAEEMLGKIEEDTKQTAQEKLSQIIHENNLSEEIKQQQVAEESSGFLGHFTAKKTSLHQQATRGLDVDMAPEIASQALGQALIDGGSRLFEPKMTDDEKLDMKKKLAEKIVTSGQESLQKKTNALQAFNALPVIKVNQTAEAKQDSVSIYLRNIDEYEKNQQKQEEDKKNPSIAAAHQHQETYQEIAEGNPIAQFMALKHPEILEYSKTSHEFDDKPLDLNQLTGR